MIGELSSAVFSVAGGARLAGLNGGFTASSGWAQLATDAIGCPSRLPRSDAAVLRGAAAVAWAAVDDQPIEAAPDEIGDLLIPDPAAHAAIGRATSRLAALRTALQPLTDSRGSHDEIP
jgi:sugar (pentulose or hexulose) kinase